MSLEPAENTSADVDDLLRRLEEWLCLPRVSGSPTVTIKLLREARARIAQMTQENALLRRALGEDSDELRAEVTRRREAFRQVLERAEQAEAQLLAERDIALADPAEQRAERYAAEAVDLTRRLMEAEAREVGSLAKLEAVCDAAAGREVSDFMLSFSEVRAAADARAPLLALVEQWKAQSHMLDCKGGNTFDMQQYVAEAKRLRACAAELEAALHR